MKEETTETLPPPTFPRFVSTENGGEMLFLDFQGHPLPLLPGIPSAMHKTYGIEDAAQHFHMTEESLCRLYGGMLATIGDQVEDEKYRLLCQGPDLKMFFVEVGGWPCPVREDDPRPGKMNLVAAAAHWQCDNASLKRLWRQGIKSRSRKRERIPA